MPTIQDAYKILNEIFGYKNFRKGQDKAILSVLSHKDTLAVMPTGGGKSLCFQIPAILFEGTSIIISPLISLMQDQINTLKLHGINAECINSMMSKTEIEYILKKAETGQIKILYIAPERLDNERFAKLVLDGNLDIPFIAIDEAHCVSQWGQDFRPSYLRINTFLGKLKQQPIIGAYTATATWRVRRDIKSILNLYEPTMIINSFDRPNLWFGVLHPSDKFETLIEYINSKQKVDANISGIIYCNTRKNVDMVYDRLYAKGIKVLRYHAGMEDKERTESQEAFISNETPIIVATNAFGMGIDKPNVRFVVHYNMPMDLEGYYQEAGRAGRDGLPSECLLLYDPEDSETNRYLLSVDNENNELTQAEKDFIKKLAFQRLKQIEEYCRQKGCFRDYILRYFGEHGVENGHCNNCFNCVGNHPDTIDTDNKNSNISLPTVIRNPSEAVLDLPDKRLLNDLDFLRQEIAHDTGVHPYIIFSDNTLATIAKIRPRNNEELSKINGVGKIKAEKFGKLIFDIIR